MNSAREKAAHALAWLLVVGLATGCEGRTRCDDVADDARALLAVCGVDLGDYEEGPAGCTDADLALEVCFLGCYQGASCDAYIRTDFDAYGDLRGCILDCYDGP